MISDDFTFKALASLLETLSNQGFLFSTLHQACASGTPEKQGVILRHDVENDYHKALTFAQVQNRLGIRGSYYFRLFPVDGNDAIIRQIAGLGHEVGYHYDDLTECRGSYPAAIGRFAANLNHLRQFGEVTTMAMEGAPMSRYDNRQLWLTNLHEKLAGHPAPASLSLPLLPSHHPELPHYDYHQFGIVAEPYFDLDFNQLFYLTDTGRRWDGWRVSLRDKVPQQQKWIRQGLVFQTTADIIRAANEGTLPRNLMITFHPQRWNDKPLPWIKELVVQRTKNLVKRGLVWVKSKPRVR